MPGLNGVFAAFGLSVSAGLNAYVPLLIVALIARFTDWIELTSPWDILSSGWVIGVIVLLGVIEFFADKIPAVNHINDAVQTFIRPVAGAILFAASAQVVVEIHPVVAMIAGLIVAGGVHVTKSVVVRPAVTAATGGAGNVPVSIVEDIVATLLSILAVVLPVIVAAFIILFTAFVIWWLWRRANKQREA